MTTIWRWSELETVLISIRARHLNNIRRGKKKYELRKSRPRVEPPFRVLCCVSGTAGTVEAEFVVDRVAFMTEAPAERIAQLACITPEEARAYRGESGDLYGWHIMAHTLIDYKALGCERNVVDYGLKRPPQGFRYVDE